MIRNARLPEPWRRVMRACYPRARRGHLLLGMVSLAGVFACADVLGIDRPEASSAHPTAPAAAEAPRADGGSALTCSTDLSTDRNHCGVCGHACGGGECQAGVCQAHDFLVGRRARGLSAVGEALYWFEPGVGIRWCVDAECSGGARFAPLALNVEATSFAGGKPLRWTNATGHVLSLSCFEPNCPAVTQPTGFRKAVLVDTREGEALVWGTERLEADGGADNAVLVCSNTSCRVIASANDLMSARFSDGGILLVERGGGLLRCNGDDCAHPTRLLDAAASERFEHATRDRLLWRTTREDGTGTFNTCTLPACDSRHVVTTFTRSNGLSAQLKGNEALVFDANSQDLRHCTIDDCKTPTLILHGENLEPFTVTDHFIYWPRASDNTIRRVAR